MKLHPRQFVRFVDGRLPSPATIAFLPGDLGAAISCTTVNVQITRDYVLKILSKHRLRYWHFAIVQRAIDKGWCVQFKSNQLEFYFDDEEMFGYSFTLVIKSARAGTECWVVTFFRSNPGYVRSKLRRAKALDAVLRYHDGMGELLGSET